MTKHPFPFTYVQYGILERICVSRELEIRNGLKDQNCCWNPYIDQFEEYFGWRPTRTQVLLFNRIRKQKPGFWEALPSENDINYILPHELGLTEEEFLGSLDQQLAKLPSDHHITRAVHEY